MSATSSKRTWPTRLPKSLRPQHLLEAQNEIESLNDMRIRNRRIDFVALSQAALSASPDVLCALQLLASFAARKK